MSMEVHSKAGLISHNANPARAADPMPPALHSFTHAALASHVVADSLRGLARHENEGHPSGLH
jgi:hypothetical protein